MTYGLIGQGTFLSHMSKRPIDRDCDELLPDSVPLSANPYIYVDRSGTIFAII
jgi:hypothetical protein